MDVTFDGYRVRGLTVAQRENFARDKLRKIELLLGYGEKNINFWNDNYEKIEEEIDTIKTLPTEYKNLKERYNKIQKDVVNQNTSQFENVFQVSELRDLIVQNNIKVPKKTDYFQEVKLRIQEPLLLTMERASEDLYNEARRELKKHCFSKYDKNGKKSIMDNYEKTRFCRNLENEPCKRACDDEIISEPEQVFEPLEENIEFTNDKYSYYELKIKFKRGIYHIKTHKIIEKFAFQDYEPYIFPKHSFRIHQSLEHIGRSAFATTEFPFDQIYLQDHDEIGLQSVIFEKGSNLKFIGEHAFAGNPLKEIDLSTTKVTSLNTDIFRDCKNLTNVKLPQNLVTISKHCFLNCERLKQIQIPNTLKYLEILAFCESGLESIDLSKTGIKVITQWCFRNCRNLKTVKLPDKLEKIGAQAFFDCISLEVLEIPDAKIKIERSAFGNCNPSLKMLFLQNGYTQDYVDQIFKS